MIRNKKLFYGWWIVSSGAILNFVTGGTFHYGFTTFFNPIRETFGWNAATTSVAVSLRSVETGGLDPLIGFLVDKVGPRRLMLFGWSIIGLGFVLMSRINSLWTFYAAFIVITTGISLGSSVVMNTTITHWFRRKRSRAMTIVFIGIGASGILVPLIALSISHYGWRETLFMIGIAAWVIGLPLSLLFRSNPEKYGCQPDGEISSTRDGPTDVPPVGTSGNRLEPGPGLASAGFTAREALRTRTFWLLAVAFFFHHLSISAVHLHIVPYLESVKIPTTMAAASVTGLTLCSLIGRVGFGFMGDFIDKRYLIAIAVTFQIAGLFIFSLISLDKVWLIIPFLLIYSLSYGTAPLRPVILADYFGRKNFGSILGLLALTTTLGGVASPVIAGWVFDTLGSYRVAWQVFTILTIPAIPLILLVKPSNVNQKQNST